ncbi:MAG: hypothetical protein Q9174_005164 [Haloplaca sp. 1 TL-2023]
MESKDFMDDLQLWFSVLFIKPTEHMSRASTSAKQVGAVTLPQDTHSENLSQETASAKGNQPKLAPLSCLDPTLVSPFSESQPRQRNCPDPASEGSPETIHSSEDSKEDLFSERDLQDEFLDLSDDETSSAITTEENNFRTAPRQNLSLDETEKRLADAILEGKLYAENDKIQISGSSSVAEIASEQCERLQGDLEAMAELCENFGREVDNRLFHLVWEPMSRDYSTLWYKLESSAFDFSRLVAGYDTDELTRSWVETAVSEIWKAE